MIDGIGNPNNIGIGTGRSPLAPLPQQGRPNLADRPIPDGAVVQGRVLSAQDGVYIVQIAGQNMTARSTVPLFQGQYFQAVWDTRGDVPLLRLRVEDSALLGRLPQSDRDVAALLLAKGLPLTDSLILGLRRELRRFGGDLRAMDSMIELLARGERISSDRVGLLSWYLAMTPGEVAEQWRRVRRELRERGRRGQEPLTSLREMKEGDDEMARFLRAHVLASKPPREPFAHAALAGAWWPLPNEDSLPARVRFHSSPSTHGDHRFSQVFFNMEGVALRSVDGQIETDGRALTVAIRAEDIQGQKFLLDQLSELQGELESLGLSLQYLGVDLRQRVKTRRYLRLDVEA
ncbi:MAG: hypothetical protein CSA35_06800 [Dethiosulfovibrio peptidovorans]|nr:MAG: hypothetical protein CSA35_06800 [Dethiosulfovibrio peptidovorans]